MFARLLARSARAAAKKRAVTFRPVVQCLERRDMLAADSLGTDFWLTFMQNSGNPTTLDLFITGDRNTTSTVTIPGLNFTRTVSVAANSVTTVSVPVQAVLRTNDTVQNLGIHVTALDEVSVYGLNHLNPTSDAFLGLPTDILGTEYINIGYLNNNTALNFSGSEFAVVATADNTTVTITPTATTNGHAAGVPYTVSMNQGQTYFLQNVDFGKDLTGTVITSDQPIAVFGGHKRTKLPTGSLSAGNHLVEELPPTVTWGKNFVTYPLATRRRGDTFRFLASTDNTQVSVNGAVIGTINRGQFIERILTTASIVQANNPILVAQYSNSQTFDGNNPPDADPFMVIVPPVEQFLGDYTVTTPQLGFPVNYINVVAPNSAIGNITLDGVIVPASSFVAIGASGYSGAQLPVQAGSHNLTGQQAFGVFVYAYANIDGYGYTGGMSLASVALANSLSLSPATDSKSAGSQETVTATVLSIFNQPLEGIRVDFVVSGENPTAGFAFTDASGQATFTYTGANAGQDTVQATMSSLTATSQINWTTGVTITPTTLDLVEGGPGLGYTVSLLTQPTSNVTITTATSARLTLSATTLVFTPTDWSPKLVTVSANENDVVEGTIVDTISHTVTGDPDFTSVVVSDVTVSIADNDVPGVSSRGLVLLEGDTRTYSMTLQSQPQSAVTITLDPDPELSLSATTLVFDPSNWNVPQSFQVTAIDNSIVDTNRSTPIALVFTSADPFYSGLTVPDVPVMIVNNDNVLFVYGTESVDTLTIIFSANLIQTVVNRKATFYPTTYSQVIVLAGTGNDSIKLLAPTLPVAVLADTGTDTVQIDGRASANSFSVDGFEATVNGLAVLLGDTEKVVLAGKNLSDSFTIASAPPFALSLQGAGGVDTLLAANQTNDWKVTGASSGTLNGGIAFGGMENLTGGSGADAFTFAASKAIGGVVDGGAGSNTLDFSAYKVAVTANLTTGAITGTKGFRNISRIVAGSGNDKLIGPNAANAWNIAAANAGSVGSVSFSGFENLTGGAQADTFTFAEGALLKGKIDGGAGSDTLDFSSVAFALTVNLQSKTATRLGGWASLEQFLGGSGANTLIGGNRVNTWNVTGSGSGDLTGGYSFQGFQNLTGGTLADTFNIAPGGDWLGWLDGGAGVDTLVGPAGATYTTTVLNAGTMNGRLFKNIENRR